MLEERDMTNHEQIQISDKIFVDVGIAPLVQLIRGMGINTEFSCEGYPWAAPYEDLYLAYILMEYTTKSFVLASTLLYSNFLDTAIEKVSPNTMRDYPVLTLRFRHEDLGKIYDLFSSVKFAN